MISETPKNTRQLKMFEIYLFPVNFTHLWHGDNWKDDTQLLRITKYSEK